MKRYPALLLAVVAASARAAAPAATPVHPTPSVVAPAAEAPGGGRGSIPSPWNKRAFEKVMAASGRPITIAEGDFYAVQARKKASLPKLSAYLEGKFGEAEPDLLKAFGDLPREYFQFNYADKTCFAKDAYEWPSQPWAVGYGSALSDYQGQAYMIHLAQPEPGDVALEVGTGSGYNCALLSRLVRHMYSIEIIKPLGSAVSNIFQPLGLSNVSTRVGDGFFGWPEAKGGFDIIIVTCAARYVPPPLLAQLKPRGRMVIPIGQPFRGKQMLYVYTKDSQGRVRSRKDMGVFFIPMTGAIDKNPAPHGPVTN